MNENESKPLTGIWKWLGYGCLFGVSWLCGTLIGWGLLNDVTATFVGIGLAPFIAALAGAFGEFVTGGPY